MKNVSIIGGSGFIGSHLADKLISKNYKVKILDIKKSNYLHRKQKFLKVNILNKNSLIKNISKNDIVFNFAGLADMDEAQNKPLETAKLNIIGTLNILLACKVKKIKKYIHASSIYANTEEGGFYAASKRAAEDYVERFCKKYKIRFSILRFGSLYGPRSDMSNGVNKMILDSIKKNQLIYYGNSNAQRKYIHIRDAVNICTLIPKKKYDRKFLNITGNKIIKVRNLLKIIAKNTQIKTPIKFLDIRNSGHYSKSPTAFIPRKPKELKVKKSVNLTNSIEELIQELKNK